VKSSSLTGVKVNRIQILVFSLSGMLSGLAGFINDLIKGGLILTAVVLQQLIRRNKD